MGGHRPPMGGHRPPSLPPPMSINPLGPNRYDRERVLLDAAKAAYLADEVTLDEFERRVSDIMNEGKVAL